MINVSLVLNVVELGVPVTGVPLLDCGATLEQAQINGACGNEIGKKCLPLWSGPVMGCIDAKLSIINRYCQVTTMRKILLTLCAVLLAMSAGARPVDVNEASDIATRFVAYHQALLTGRQGAPSASGVQLLYTADVTDAAHQQGGAAFYIFSSADSWVMVSGDDRCSAVLAYGDGTLDMSNELPDGMRVFMQMYREQVSWLLAHPQAQVSAPARVQAPVIKPLLTATWDQTDPYNRQCPEINGERCVTGCAATSLSMVMYYWRWPQGETSGVDGYSWQSGGATQTAEALPSTTFDWDNMLSHYGRSNFTTQQANAVAWLMRYVGQSEHMGYGTGSSGTGSRNIQDALRTFGYDDNARVVMKEGWWHDEGYSDEEWAELMLCELESGRPLEFCAYTASWDGHAFNVDGYDGDGGWHVNFGWGGSGNGYYRLNAFSYSGSTFSVNQTLFTGVQPPLGYRGAELRPSSNRVSVKALVDKRETATFMLQGYELTGDVTLALDNTDGTFDVTPTSISANDAAQGTTVTVTFAPRRHGDYRAHIVCSTAGLDDVTINLYGTATIEKHDPVMLPADSLNVLQGTFLSQWQDSTPSHNVEAYTLQVTPQPDNELRLEEHFDRDTTGTSTADRSSQLDDITGSAGWTGSKVYGGNGYLRLGSTTSKGWLVTPAIDVSGIDGVMTVVVNASYVPNDNAGRLTVTCGDNDTVLTLTDEVRQYEVLMPCPDDDDAVQVRFANSIKGKRVMLHDIAVYAGNATPVDSLPSFNHEGITTTRHWLTGMAAGNYWLRVQTSFIDETLSAWSNRVLVKFSSSAGDVNHDGEVTVADVNAIIDIILGNVDSEWVDDADVNDDGEVTIADVNAVIDIILADV